MKDQLVRLVFVSKNVVAGGPRALADQIEDILAVGGLEKRQLNLTGALVFNSGAFAEVLEGRRQDVETAFKRIQRDPRHRDVRVLCVEPIDKRLFPNWSVGYLGKSREDERVLGHFGEMTGFDDRYFARDHILKLMREVAADEEGDSA